jgi:hypothetical protein
MARAKTKMIPAGREAAGAATREAELLARCKRLAAIARRLRAQRDGLMTQIESAAASVGSAQRQLAGVARGVVMATELETLLRQELDVESLLRTTLEFLLKRAGSTNAAIYLPQASGDFSLGAYVNYDLPRETAEELLEQMGGVLAPAYEHRPGMHDLRQAPEELPWLSGSKSVVFCCRDARECTAVIVLFRQQSGGFEAQTKEKIATILGLFGEQLARIARTQNRHLPIDGWETQSGAGGVM